MRATTVRFTDAIWDLLEEEAGIEGVSAAQFVRDATVMRIAFSMGRRGDARLGAALAGVRGLAPDGEGPRAAAGLDDAERLRALQRTGLLDAPPQEGFERITRLATELLGAPVSLVSLVSDDRQVFASCRGLPEPWATERQTPLSHSFCQHVVSSGEPLAVSDAREHPELKDNLAIRDLGVVGYLGVPLKDPDEHVLGSVCVIDSRPRSWSEHQRRLLEDLAGTAQAELALRRN